MISARHLRVLQLVTVALLIAGNVAWSVLAAFEVVPSTSLSVIPFSLSAVVSFALLCVRAQRAAHQLGGPPPVSEPVPTVFFCMLLGFVGVPITIWRSAVATAVAANDDAIRQRGVALAWLVAVAPFMAVFFAIFFGVGGFWVSPVVTVVLQAIATQVIVSPLIAELDARAPLGGVSDATSAAVRTL